MPEQENTTTESTPAAPASAESAIVDAPDISATPETTTPSKVDSKPIPVETEVNADVSAFEALSGLKLDSSAKTKDLSSKKPEPFPKLEEKESTTPKKELPPLTDEHTKKSTDPSKRAVDRDFSGLTPEEIVVGKGMALASFQNYKNLVISSKKLKEEVKTKDELIKNLQEGKEILPANYYENPDAVIFSPSYRSTAKNTEIASLVVNHWETQLLKVKNGEEWTDLDNDPKTGELVLGQNRPATVQDEVRILSYLSGAQNQLNTYKNKLSTITSNFKNENSRILSTIKETEKKFFPQYEAETPQVAQVGEEIKKLGISESNPIFSLMSKSGALNIQLSELLTSKEKEISDLKNKLGIKESIKKDALRAGPSSSSLSSPGAGNGENTSIPSYDDFKNKLIP